MTKNLGLAILSGLLLGLSWPTYGFTLLLFIGFVPLLFVEQNIREQPTRRGGIKLFGFAYITFLLFNAITTWWLWYSSSFGMFFQILVKILLKLYILNHKLRKSSKKTLNIV